MHIGGSTGRDLPRFWAPLLRHEPCSPLLSFHLQPVHSGAPSLSLVCDNALQRFPTIVFLTLHDNSLLTCVYDIGTFKGKDTFLVVKKNQLQ